MNGLSHSNHSAPFIHLPDQQVEGAKLTSPQSLKDPVRGIQGGGYQLRSKKRWRLSCTFFSTTPFSQPNATLQKSGLNR